jgi:hypothetical protein
MSDAPFTEADVSYLLRTRKIVQGVIKDTTSDEDASLFEVIYRVARVGDPGDDIRLRLHARRPKPVLASLPRIKPSASLLWHGERIRGIDYKIVHSRIRNGLVVGEIRGWHEHRWTEADRDKPVRDINETMKKVQEDFRSIIRFCMTRWRIQLKDDEKRQEILKFMR